MDSWDAIEYNRVMDMLDNELPVQYATEGSMSGGRKDSNVRGCISFYDGMFHAWILKDKERSPVRLQAVNLESAIEGLEEYERGLRNVSKFEGSFGDLDYDEIRSYFDEILDLHERSTCGRSFV